MEKKLRATPLVVQLPLGQGRDFTGVIDLLTMDVLMWNKGGDGRNFTCVPLITHTNEDGKKDFKKLSSKQLIDNLNAENLPIDSKLVSEALDMRYSLAEQVSEYACVHFIDHYITAGISEQIYLTCNSMCCLHTAWPARTVRNSTPSINSISIIGEGE